MSCPQCGDKGAPWNSSLHTDDQETEGKEKTQDAKMKPIEKESLMQKKHGRAKRERETETQTETERERERRELFQPENAAGSKTPFSTGV